MIRGRSGTGVGGAGVGRIGSAVGPSAGEPAKAVAFGSLGTPAVLVGTAFVGMAFLGMAFDGRRGFARPAEVGGCPACGTAVVAAGAAEALPPAVAHIPAPPNATIAANVSTATQRPKRNEPRAGVSSQPAGRYSRLRCTPAHRTDEQPE
jgi:hypothetical protein